jgi:hypothetical protein
MNLARILLTSSVLHVVSSSGITGKIASSARLRRVNRSEQAQLMTMTCGAGHHEYPPARTSAGQNWSEYHYTP